MIREYPIELFMDGDSWCALIGEDLQSGTAGFGDTEQEALSDLRRAVESLGLSWANYASRRIVRTDAARSGRREAD